MLILKPIAHETIWGGQTLQKYFSEPYKKIGHMYTLFDDKKNSNVILNGKHKGKSFHEYFVANRKQFGLEKFDYFPLVLAIVEASENLSLQVHPDDEAARKIENAPYGKNESWYFLRAPQSGEIYNGSKIFSLDEIKRLIGLGRAKEISDTLKTESGDYVFVAAGTLHAITAGALVYEIEENAEFTYRFYDFDRVDDEGKKRPLHIEQALKALKPKLKSVALKYDGAITERLYTTEIFSSLESYKNNSLTLECLTLIDENATATLDGVKINFGMTIVTEPDEKISLNVGKCMLARVNF